MPDISTISILQAIIAKAREMRNDATGVSLSVTVRDRQGRANASLDTFLSAAVFSDLPEFLDRFIKESEKALLRDLNDVITAETKQVEDLRALRDTLKKGG